MKVIIEPTAEMWNAPLNGQLVPTRIWKGKTSGGVEIWAAVVSIVPENDEDSPKLKSELPPFMRPARETYDINLD